MCLVIIFELEVANLFIYLLDEGPFRLFMFSSDASMAVMPLGSKGDVVTSSPPGLLEQRSL